MRFVYGLRATKEERIMYVGCATIPKRRMRLHIDEARRGRSLPICKWVLGLLQNGAVPSMEILEEVQESEWKQKEQSWIATLNPGLLNVYPGGKSFPVSRESRIKAGLTLKGRKFSPEHCARISAGKAGLKRPDAVEGCRRMAEANRGKKMNLSESGLEARRANGKKTGVVAGKRIRPQEERERIRQQMIKIWAERKKAANGQ